MKMKIVQFSPIRSGSTLVYNILLHTKQNKQNKQYIKYEINKEHIYKYDSTNYYVITIRHPYNSIISSCLRYDLPLTNKNLIKQMNEYIDNGGRCMVENDFNKERHCVLIYEEFHNNIDLIINKIETLLDYKYSTEDVNKLKIRFCKQNMKQIANKYDNFEDYDEKSHIHGRHISQYNGETNYKTLLSQKQINILDKNMILQTIIKKYY